MFKEFGSQLLRHPFELIAGLLLIGLGVALTSSGALPEAPGYLLYLGTAGTTFGGVVVSWTAGKAMSRNEALEEVRSQLNLVSKSLGQAAGQVGRVVDQCVDGSLPSATGFALVGQSANLIGAQVSAIQNIIGNPFEADDLLETLDQMETLAARLDRKDRRDEVQNRLQKIKANLTAVGQERTRSTETLGCPRCGAKTQVSLGINQGDTAVGVCLACNHRFNSHRRMDGTFFTRDLGPATPTFSPERVNPRTFVKKPCPRCQVEVRVARRGPAVQEQEALCLECGASLVFDFSADSIRHDGDFEILPGVVVGRYGSGGTGARPVVACDGCDSELRGVIRRTEEHFAVDKQCRRLHRVRHTDFERWRAEHDAVAEPAGD